MQTPSKTVKCAMLDGSAWNTERKYMERCEGKVHDLCVGCETPTCGLFLLRYLFV